MRSAIILVCLVILQISLSASEIVFRSDFSKGVDGFSPYANGSVQAVNGTLELSKGGFRAVQVPSPGKYRIRLGLQGKGGARLAIFGGLMTTNSETVHVNSGNGTAALLEMDYFVQGKELSFTVFSAENPPMPLILESVEIEKLEMPDAAAVEVVDVAFEAENHAGGNGTTLSQPEASGGAFRRGKQWYRPVDKLPMPLTSLPVYVWVLARKRSEIKTSLVLYSERQALAAGEVTGQQFGYVRLGPVDARAFPNYSALGLAGDAGLECDIDRMVVSSNPELSPDELDNIPSHSPTEACFSAFPCETAPLIDGSLDDAAWSGCLEITPFRLNGGATLASEQTIAKLAWDKTHLYVAFQAFESALFPYAQRLHEFKNNLNQPDLKKAYENDAVILLLKRENSEVMYEFVVNPSGNLTESLNSPPDYWGSRKSASFGAKAAARIDHEAGFYAVELAIPFASTGGFPAAGETMHASLSRMEKSKREVSSFQAVKTGFHNLDEFARLHLATRTAPGKLLQRPNFSPGINQIIYHNANNLLFLNSIEDDLGKKQFVNVDGTFLIDKSGEIKFTCSILDRQSLATLLTMPAEVMRTKSCKLEYDPAPGVIVTLNGKPAVSGLSLTTGLNTLRVSSASNRTFRIENMTITENSGWKSEEDGSFSINLLLDHSKLWPDWSKEGIYIPAGSTQQIMFPPVAPQSMQLSDYTFYFDIPESFIFEGASGLYGYYSLTVSGPESLTEENRPIKRYAITFKNNITATAPGGPRFVFAAIRAPAGDAGQKEIIRFHCGSKSNYLCEVPQEISVSVLPPLNGRMAKRIRTQMWIPWGGAIDNKQLAATLAVDMEKMGVTELNYKTTGSMKYFTLMNFSSWSISPVPFVQNHPDTALHPFKSDTPNPAFTCPSVMAENPEFRHWFENAYARTYEKFAQPPDIVCWDYEHGVYDLYLSCKCERCLTRFSQSAGLQSLPSPQEIQSKHQSAWTNFMTSQMAGTARLFYETIKKITPKVEFYIYSGYQSELTKFQYGTDWSKLGAYMDYGGAGYGRPLQDIAATNSSVAPKPMLSGIIAVPYDFGARQTPNPVSEARMMQAMLDSSGGILIYMYQTLDGRTFHALAEVTRMVAENEAFFGHPGQLDDLDAIQVSGGEYFVRSDGTGNLLLVFTNGTSGKLAYHAKLKSPRKIVDCRTKQPLNSVNTTLEPGTFAVYRLEK